MNSPCTLRGIEFSPSLFLAPMAGITNSAFRRLLADFGGYGALYTEMLSAKALASEDLDSSPFTKRRPQEGQVIYQIRIGEGDPITKSIERLKRVSPTGLDINLGCPAPEIKRFGAGTALFDNRELLKFSLDEARKCWDGLLTVKCRLGHNKDGWEDVFYDRIRLFEECGIDAITVHTRFAGDKLKRGAKWSLYKDITEKTHLPVIANGDITEPVRSNDLYTKGNVAGLMIGRIAVVKPWIFKEFSSGHVDIDYKEVWERFYKYVLDDFPPEKAIGRVKEFIAYYSRNFFFGHDLFAKIQSTTELKDVYTITTSFLSKDQQLDKSPSLFGI